jgi:TetR/AcrR family transcriptional repressor of lmrAB and yxaGH operons
VVLAKKGLQGASFSKILEESGAPRGSLYHHFPGGKDELVLEAIELAQSHGMAVIEKLAGHPADEVASAFINMLRTVLSRSNFEAGCSVVAVTVAAQTPELRERVGQIFYNWRRRLGELLEQGGVRPGRGDALAATLIAATEGAVVLARAEQSMAPFDLVANELLVVIGNEMSKGRASA